MKVLVKNGKYFIFHPRKAVFNYCYLLRELADEACDNLLKSQEDDLVFRINFRSYKPGDAVVIAPANTDGTSYHFPGTSQAPGYLNEIW